MNDLSFVDQLGDVTTKLYDTPVEDLTVQGIFDDFNGIPFPTFFGHKEAYKTISFWDRLGWNIKQFGSIVFWLANFNFWGVLFEVGGYDLGLIKKLFWMQRRLDKFGYDYDFQVLKRNAEFLLFKEAAATAAALWFRVFFLWNLFIRITAGGLFDADFDELDAKGYKYSLSQATSYHYWEGKESHGLFKMLWVNYITDTFKIIFGIIPLVLLGIPYTIYEVIYVLLYIPVVLPLRLITPWDEKVGETPALWWTNAIELGLYDPQDPPSNMFEITDARTQYLSKFDKDDEEEEEED